MKLVASIVLLVGGASALTIQTKQFPEANTEAAAPADTELLPSHKGENKPVTQVLRSDEGMAYYGTVHIGGQAQEGIYDTGSFDLVVVSSCDADEEDTLKQAEEINKKSKDATLGYEDHDWGPFNYEELPQKIRDMLPKSFARQDKRFDQWPAKVQDMVPGRHHHGHKKQQKHSPQQGPNPEEMQRAKEEAIKLKAQNITCCRTAKCPFAAYHTKASGLNFLDDGKSLEKIVYGSGKTTVKPAHDHVQIKENFYVGKNNHLIADQNVPVKVIVDHEVELFEKTKLQAIVGVGPGKFDDRANRMTSHLGIQRFTFCLHEDANKDGKIIWNDKRRHDDADWMTVPSPAVQFWGAPSSSWTLTDKWGPWSVFTHTAPVGCEGGCGAVIDTGTSLITPPKEVTQAITAALESGSVEDCSDLSKFPTLNFKLGDHDFSLPPESYIADAGTMEMDGQEAGNMHEELGLAVPLLPMNKASAKVALHRRRNGEAAEAHQCVLLLGGDMPQPTQYGPMLIMGMPFFRKYAVQFDLAEDFENVKAQEGAPTRMMHVSEAAPDCEGPIQGGRFRQEGPRLQKVNLSKLRTSKLAADAKKAANSKGLDFHLKTITI